MIRPGGLRTRPRARFSRVALVREPTQAPGGAYAIRHAWLGLRVLAWRQTGSELSSYESLAPAAKPQGRSASRSSTAGALRAKSLRLIDTSLGC